MRLCTTIGNSSRDSISHHVFLSGGDIFARLVEVKESLPNLILGADFSKFQTASQRPLISTEDHISLDGPNTQDSLGNTKVDASKIKFRITKIVDGTLQRRTSTSSTWTEILPTDGTYGTQYQEFAPTQLRNGLVPLFPDASVSALTFEICSMDDGLPGSSRESPAPQRQ